MLHIKLSKRIISVLLSVALILAYIPLSAVAVPTLLSETVAETVVDPSTADSWEHMMGTDTDGNRYSGRVWADKSVYKNGDTMDLGGNAGGRVTLEADEAFQIVYSVLGSTMSSMETTTTTGPMDVVLILDTSTSMDDTSGGVTRLQRTIEAANTLLSDLLTLDDVRVAIVTYNNDSETVLALDTYNNGIVLSVNNYYYNNRPNQNGIVTAKDKNNRTLGSDDGYVTGTNLQSGIDRGFRILSNASNAAGRIPVAIVLTDGRANRASQEGFYELVNHSDQDGTGNVVDRNLYLSTLLNAAYGKTKIEEHYGKDATVYTVGVDISDNAEAKMFMNPGDPIDGFQNYGWNTGKEEISRAYENFLSWANGNTVTYSGWTFDHNYPKQNGAITAAKIAANINYADTYYDVSSTDLEITFEQIYEELSSTAFNPISTTTRVEGATGVENTPLIYVDFIGQYMEVKDIKQVSLFGASYDVIQKADGTYVVDTATGTNPTTNESWNTAEDIIFTLTRQADGTQKFEIKINQEILPILMEKVDSETVGDTTTSTITELKQDPLRVFYTVGVDSNILLPNGEVDVSKIQGYAHINDNDGTVSFYSNRFGVKNAAATGDAHVGFKPSAQNRYYYHQSNQGIFTKITDKDTGREVTISPNEEYGIVWNASQYELTWMNYAEYQTKQPTDKVYTYVTYYHPTPSATDAANAAEKVTYLIYADWAYMKESAAFYDNTAEKYVNYDAANGYAVADVGVAIPDGKVETTINAYKQANPNADIYAVLGMGSLRTSRLHNMTVNKLTNPTGTATQSYSPEYTHERAADHNENDVVVWLGNNGRLTLNIDTGIALTKNVTEPIGNADDTYALTVTVPAGVDAEPVVVDAHGNTVAATYTGNVLTVNVKAGETVYISGIPGGTACTIGENIPNTADYYISSKTDAVTVPTLSQVLNNAPQFAAAQVTNTPNKYGDLVIVKDIAHNLEQTPQSMHQKVFTFKVQLPVELHTEEYLVDKTNATAFTADKVVVGSDGSFEVSLKDNESITILNLPENTPYTVTEIGTVAGYENTTGSVSGTIRANEDQDAHFINTYKTTAIKPQITVTGRKVLTDVHNTYNGTEEFTFVLSRFDETTGRYVPVGTTTARAGVAYTFDLAQLLTDPLDIGEYHFQVTEQTGSTQGMSYDTSRGIFVVKITDTDANGELEYTVENVANTDVIGNEVYKDFRNIYDVDRTHVDINISKTLNNTTGVHLTRDMFHFILVNKADASDTRTVTTDAEGKATIRISELAEGTHSYTLSEVDGGLAGMDYDDTVYTVNITVTNQGGTLVAVAQVEGAATNTDNTVDVAFENTYALGSASHTIAGTKHMTEREPKDNEFTFALYETDSSFVIGVNDNPIATTENTGNAFAFDAITYTKVGTYYYSVKEEAGTVPGVTYDATHYHVTVKVEVDPADPTKLAVTQVLVNKIGTNEGAPGQIVFVNKYRATPTEYTISGRKILHGRAPQHGEFSFTLYENGTPIETVSNEAGGRFTFSAIPYARAGVHTYTIEENTGSLPGVAYDGVNHPVTVTVTVTDTNSVLSASANISNAAIAFENTYTAQPAQVTFKGTKTLKGAELVDGDFTFRLYKTDISFDITNANAQLLASAENVDGAFAFARTLDKTGTYFFTIVEDATADPVENVVYDRTHHNFTVQVTDAGDGQLKATVTNPATGVAGTPAASVSADVAFTNAMFDQVTKKEVYLADNITTLIDGKQVKAGEELTYFITYTNYTGEKVVADILDTIPAHTAYVEDSASHNGTFAGDHVNWILNVEKDESVTVSFRVKVKDTQAIMANTALVRDGVNTYTTNTVVNHTVDEQLVKEVFAAKDPTASIDGKQVSEGDELLYKLTFTNATGSAAAIKITDKLPENTTYVADSADNGGVLDKGTITWEIQSVPAWGTVTVSFKVTVNAGIGAAKIENQATATDGTNKFESGTVSNFTVLTETVPEPTEPENTENQPTQSTPIPSNPKTGDDTRFGLLFTLLFVSCGGLIGVSVFGAKKKEEEAN